MFKNSMQFTVNFQKYVKENDNIGTDLLLDYYSLHQEYPSNLNILERYMEAKAMFREKHLRDAFYFLKYNFRPCFYDLYFLKSKKLGLVKIGKTSDILKRQTSLERMHGDLELVIFEEGLGYLESFLHKKLAFFNEPISKNGSQMREWFSLKALKDKECLKIFERNNIKFLKLNK